MRHTKTLQMAHWYKWESVSLCKEEYAS